MKFNDYANRSTGSLFDRLVLSPAEYDAMRAERRRRYAEAWDNYRAQLDECRCDEGHGPCLGCAR